MVRELEPLDVSAMPELAQLADEVERTGRPRRLRRDGRDIAVLIPTPTALDEGYQSIPALSPPRSWKVVTRAAAEEHAEHAAREGMPASG